MTVPHTLAFVVFWASAYMRSKTIVQTPTGCSCVLDVPDAVGERDGQTFLARAQQVDEDENVRRPAHGLRDETS